MADARKPQGGRRGTIRQPCGQTDATATHLEYIIIHYIYIIATANLEMKTVITPRYNPTAAPAACKNGDTPYGDSEATADPLRLPQVSLDFEGPPYPSRRADVI